MPIHTEPMTVNIGPQHPSTHGVFRLRVTFDGEEILEVEPIFGYLHRGTEKLAEERNYTQIVTLTDRLDYVSSMINNQAYCLAVEELLGVEVPQRAKYLRTLTAELQRVASHLMGIGFFLQDLGTLGTPLMYGFRSREKILDLFEMLCGARITLSYMRPGGVFFDAPDDFWPALDQFLEDFDIEFEELERLILENEIVMVRTRGVSVLPLDLAINASVSGPTLRASGSDWDWRKKAPYDAYDRMDFEVPTATGGDNYDRFWVRMQEIRQSIRIVRQCVEQIEPGATRAEVPLILRPKPGTESYGRVEASKGELAFYVVSDGGISPYRMKVRSPSLINLTVTEHLLVGWKLSDMIVTLGSLDINMGEVDR
ncbi:MAG: NADH-quinone oxidoreductase subunit D [Chloroflexota bacterium]|jgi:NADH-quinone oxidoreductase subunit D|nr:MAG: NADH-quinone oxidoreductase subunit D [SAR202 cluster bacterium]MCH2671259.1 NADH-quinone oxidoreductase subunit D [Dehalococcoidia bacterium]MEC9014669.1 NADH-quinone oxidoreductase subunit D [Chloroflexota bacterium]MED5208414.1 NADH-quinone oxidoreductase subunit D [Chloroflexota bacterium]MEE3013749.1 NADH-quinone oxidoreductase subunit D [Chloroflexota bacterium]